MIPTSRIIDLKIGEDLMQAHDYYYLKYVIIQRFL